MPAPRLNPSSAPSPRMVALQFARSSLLYDIANYAYIEGHKMEVDSDAPLRAHLLSDITAEGNVDRVSRVLSLVHAQVRDLLRSILAPDAPPPQTAAEAQPPAVRDDIECPEVYVVSIVPPRGMSRHTVDFLAKLIHEYMVCRVIHDWLAMAHPAYAVSWAEKARGVEARIAQLSSASAAPLLRRSHPW